MGPSTTDRLDVIKVTETVLFWWFGNQPVSRALSQSLRPPSCPRSSYGEGVMYALDRMPTEGITHGKLNGSLL